MSGITVYFNEDDEIGITDSTGFCPSCFLSGCFTAVDGLIIEICLDGWRDGARTTVPTHKISWITQEIDQSIEDDLMMSFRDIVAQTSRSGERPYVPLKIRGGVG